MVEAHPIKKKKKKKNACCVKAASIFFLFKSQSMLEINLLDTLGFS